MAKKLKKINITKTFDDEKLKLFEQNEFKFKNPLIEYWREGFIKRIIFVAIVVVAMIFFFLNINVVKAFCSKLVSILMPIIIGFILMYLMSPLYDKIVKYYSAKENKNSKHKFRKDKFAKTIATFVCLIAVLLIGAGLIVLFVPQLYSSISNFIEKANGYLDTSKLAFKDFISKTKDEATKEMLSHIYKSFGSNVAKASNIDNIDFSSLFVNLYNGFYTSFKTILNIFVGLVVMIYTLNMKEQLANNSKKIMFALLNKGVAQKLLAEIRFANKVFSGFIVGKILDSLIIGILCYICCLIMKMPYTPLVSVIVGVTNIIPFFGPFIGAIPSFVIILLEEPFTWKPWGFLVFILALQQLDGNVIGPKILGDKTGVGSFWVLFSILLFGGLFGFVGMIIAVPLWAIISKIFNEYIVVKLKEKNYPLTTEEYQQLKKYYKSLQEK